MGELMIEAERLSKRYGSFQALDDVSFEVRKGEVVGFLGPNGAGKSTTMRILTCFIAPTQGTARIAGKDVFDDPMRVRESVGYLPESNPLYTEMLVLEYLEYAAELRGFRGGDARKRIKRAAEQTSLEDVIGKEIRALSKGYRQRVGLAQALLHEPPILILDEPMSGLDPNQAEEIRDLIKNIGKERTVILSTHDLAEVEKTADRVLVIAKGKLVADDTPAALRASAGLPTFEMVFSKDTKLTEIQNELGAIGGVKNVKDISTAEPAVSIMPRSDVDLRAELIAVAREKNWPLLELQRHAPDMEQVFKTLTMDETATPSKPPAKSKSESESSEDARESKDA